MDDVAPADAAAAQLDLFLSRSVPFGFSGACLIATGGEVRLASGYGWAQRKARRPNHASTVFSLGSVTKPLTATAILALVDQRHLNLQDRLGDRLPAVPPDKAGITIEHVLSHTAGLPDASGEDFEPGERAAVLRKIFSTPLRFSPGTAYAYSNTGYSVLAALLERATGDSYEGALRGLVLDPAGMHRTGYRLPDWNRDELAHFSVGDADVGVHLDKTFPNWHIMGNGEMLSTVWDLYRFTRALHANTLLSTATLEDAWTPRRNAYGLGWAVGDGPQGRTVGHDGASTNGVSARLQWYRDTDTVVALLCNRDYSGGFLVHAMTPRLEALAFGGTAPMPPAVPADSPSVTPHIAGDYQSRAGGRATIRPSTDGLTVEIVGQDVLDVVTASTGHTDEASRSLDLVRALLSGDDAPLLAELDDRDRLERYRRFIHDRLGSDAAAVEVDGSMPAEISIGPVTAVQLSCVDAASPEDTLRMMWSGSRLVGLSYGSRPLLEVPLVPVDEDRLLIHHLALGTTAEVTVDGSQRPAAITVTGAHGVSVRMMRQS